MGATGFYWVVDDNQITSAKDDRGLFRHRQEIIDWRWKPTPLTESGMVKDEPVKFADDAMNSLMMVTQVWGPRSTPLTERERREMEFPEYLRIENAPKPGSSDPWAYDAFEWARIIHKDRQKRQKQMSGEGGGNHWANDIYGQDELWNPRSPLAGTADDPWRDDE